VEAFGLCERGAVLRWWSFVIFGGRSGITLSMFMHCSAGTRVKRVPRRERLRVLNQAER
jgi:hypothetical protein